MWLSGRRNVLLLFLLHGIHVGQPSQAKPSQPASYRKMPASSEIIVPTEGVMGSTVDPDEEEPNLSTKSNRCGEGDDDADTPDGHINKRPRAWEKVILARLDASLRHQAELVLALADRDAELQALRDQHRRNMDGILASLAAAEVTVRRDQERVRILLDHRERAIARQEEHIKALLNLNRRMAAKLESSTGLLSSSKNCSSSNADVQKVNDLLTLSNNVQQVQRLGANLCKNCFKVNSGARCSCGNVFKPVGEQLKSDSVKRSFTIQSKNSTIDPSSKTKPSSRADERATWEQLRVLEASVRNLCGKWQVPGSPHPIRLEALAEEVETGVGDQQRHMTATGYNRIMGTNHRSVTKPRDVKYRKINRVKSRSLEELRGKLRTWSHPLFLNDKHNS